MPENAEAFLKTGFTHVIPLGFDHILFILSIFLSYSKLKPVIIQCSVFTLAHSLTLALAASGYQIISSRIIEPLIAISIFITSVQNILSDKENKSMPIIIFMFGLIHGLGFANALQDTGIPENHFVSSLLFFNIGVEFGQIAVISAAYLLIGKWFSEKSWYRERIVMPASSIIACVALYWTINRIFMYG